MSWFKKPALGSPGGSPMRTRQGGGDSPKPRLTWGGKPPNEAVVLRGPTITFGRVHAQPTVVLWTKK